MGSATWPSPASYLALWPIFNLRRTTISILVIPCVAALDPFGPDHRSFALCVVRGDSKITGSIVFEQESESAPTKITWDISGQDANAKRGMHIHTFGDNTNGCTSAGPHFNPHNKTHGAPTDTNRHVGDLGNIDTDANGNSKGSTEDSFVKLIGPESVIGRTIVVHGGTDDLGKGGNEESLKTGNAGPRPACGT
ncbi:Superoxide dismutase [Colletotrichum karsti]|uniref:Superoxide dismutase [Cu-Zn] n=1 Tax=Colletotrichum karsti TaxID=1095194 RepID=A0A9P6I9H2_9PEZI|nr:Superoxide dismutase [Colletotrichum karsti]KAF9879638.1 Superoxide dismutase [Colletotrichum karsti]